MTYWLNQRKSVDPQKDIKNIFARVKLHNVHINPSKYAFGIDSGKFMHFMLSERGIEVNLENL